MDIKHLSFGYTKKQLILKDISLSFAKGKITTLLGSNGCGKSTLFNLCTRNLRPKTGIIELEGTNVFHMKPVDFAKKVAIVHQQNRITGDITVRQLVSYGRTPYVNVIRPSYKEEDNAAIEWAIEKTGLEEFADRPVIFLSGGQRQRTWIAMALAQKSEMIFLDEPTTYLDVRYQKELLELIKALNHDLGITIVMVLHDINQALGYSDDVIGLSEGKVAFKGAAEDVITSESVSRLFHVPLKVADFQNRKIVIT